MRRKTIQHTIEISGAGLHTGMHSSLKLLPKFTGEPGWIINQTPIKECQIISGELSTRIRADDHVIGTIEHLFAALSGAGITDICVHTGSQELPILDGSSREWFTRLHTVDLDTVVEPLCITQKYIITQGNARLSIEPSDSFSAIMTVKFEGYPPESFDAGMDCFKDAMAARTFGYLDELEALQARELALGASPDSVLALYRADDEERIEQNPKQLNELAKHKWLDLIGDLSLVGRPILGRVESTAGGHRINHILVNQLRELAW